MGVGLREFHSTTMGEEVLTFLVDRNRKRRVVTSWKSLLFLIALRFASLRVASACLTGIMTRERLVLESFTKTMVEPAFSKFFFLSAVKLSSERRGPLCKTTS